MFERSNYKGYRFTTHTCNVLGSSSFFKLFCNCNLVEYLAEDIYTSRYIPNDAICISLQMISKYEKDAHTLPLGLVCFVLRGYNIPFVIIKMLEANRKNYCHFQVFPSFSHLTNGNYCRRNDLVH